MLHIKFGFNWPDALRRDSTNKKEQLPVAFKLGDRLGQNIPYLETYSLNSSDSGNLAQRFQKKIYDL